ncbi:UDP-N-acetyl-D-glucosamine dehydrogenase [Nocardioides sp. Root122]|uniref:nucleotide sugar dehydrogenase n=1 Tax=Nocardioides TaxID=1839 RepID=UPI000702897E|nr:MULTISPECIES: nucleotide sugar dehydrogenase [Nocardioides]KQV77715.1 UDP-N-acetyl-D-glucosamine dehydrogenase [Nocardioides sp. Root122]MCK9822180.1 nucleotide sugar dehydrogenase [Nocardioides cavernae]
MNNVVIIGLGYVGLPLAAAASAAGFSVTGLDRSARVVEGLSAGRSHIDDLGDEDVKHMLENGFVATNDETVLETADTVVICVPTPLTLDGSPDLGAVRSASEAAASRLQRGALVVLESTTFPGTTEDVLLPMFAGRGDVGVDFYLAFSPERVDPGNEQFTITNTPKVVGGLTPACSGKAEEFYSRFIDTVVVAKGAREAETAKLLENTYRHINIALVNEMARVCHEMDIDVWDVIRCASTKPFGFQAFYPGPGVGGHCIPIDPNYLSYAVKSRLGYPLRFVELAQEINSTMPSYVFRRVQDLLNDQGKAVRGSRVLLVGVTYKPNIADQRESPAVDVYAHMTAAGAEVVYFDPMVDDWAPARVSVPKHRDIGDVTDVDAVVVLQHHEGVDLSAMLASGATILDTRGKIDGPSVVRL